MADTLKVVTNGTVVSVVTWMEWLPEVISITVGCLTAVYLSVKIVKELK
jgi:hypothetical protein